jgi:hypothetical protein
MIIMRIIVIIIIITIIIMVIRLEHKSDILGLSEDLHSTEIPVNTHIHIY